MRRGKSNSIEVRGTETPRNPSGIAAADADPIREFHVEYEEAVRVIRRSRGRTIFVCVEQGARRKEGGALELVTGNICTSRDNALWFLSSAYTDRRRRECWVRIAICSTCLFVG